MLTKAEKTIMIVCATPFLMPFFLIALGTWIYVKGFDQNSGLWFIISVFASVGLVVTNIVLLVIFVGYLYTVVNGL